MAEDAVFWETSQVRGWKDVPDLDRMFGFFNRKFFGGKLPKPGIFWRVFRSINIHGQTGVLTNVEKKTERPAIFIAWSLIGKDAELRWTMLHEMIHIEEAVIASKIKEHHGPKFWARMNKLMKAGAFKGII
jgi:hypothetical protein